MTEKVSRRSRKNNTKSKRRKSLSNVDLETDTVIVESPASTVDEFKCTSMESPVSESSTPSTQDSNRRDEDTEASSVSPPQYELNHTFGRDRANLQSQLAKLEQLFGYELFEECFVGQFVGMVTSARATVNPERPRSWFFSIPNFLSTTNIPSVKYCIRAAALAYYSVTHHDKGAEMDAVRWYLAGLESHRNSLAVLRSGSSHGSERSSSPSKIPDCQDICVPMMFSYFESIKGTGNAWAQHILAAVEMLLVRGPMNCRVGHEHAMFRSLRPYEVRRMTRLFFLRSSTD